MDLPSLSSSCPRFMPVERTLTSPRPAPHSRSSRFRLVRVNYGRGDIKLARDAPPFKPQAWTSVKGYARATALKRSFHTSLRTTAYPLRAAAHCRAPRRARCAARASRAYRAAHRALRMLRKRSAPCRVRRTALPSCRAPPRLYRATLRCCHAPRRHGNAAFRFACIFWVYRPLFSILSRISVTSFNICFVPCRHRISPRCALVIKKRRLLDWCDRRVRHCAAACMPGDIQGCDGRTESSLEHFRRTRLSGIFEHKRGRCRQRRRFSSGFNC